MAAEANKTMIGAFVVGAAGLAVAAVILFGSGNFYRDAQAYVLFFSGSVKGLSIGAPVQMKGVQVGTVSSIQLLFDQEDVTLFNRVDIKITPDSILLVEAFEDCTDGKCLDTGAVADRLIAKGLRAKLALQSFVTGSLLVALDFYPGTPRNLLGIDTDVKELPTLPSDMQELSQTIEQIPLQEMAQKIMNVVDRVEAMVTSPEPMNTIRSVGATADAYTRFAQTLTERSDTLIAGIDQTLGDTRRLLKMIDTRFKTMADTIDGAAGDAGQVMRDIDKNAGPVLSEMEQTLRTSRAAIAEMEGVLANLNQATGESSPMVYRIEGALTELTASARALRALADYLFRHPEAIVHGKQNIGEER